MANMSKVRNAVIALLILVITGGIVYAMWPLIHGAILTEGYKQAAQEFIEKTDTEETEDEQQMGAAYYELYSAWQAFNERIYENKQAELGGEGSYEEQLFDLSGYGIEDEIVGVIRIPALNLKMPLYLGATEEHMAAGAAQMSYTSCPIGGENTNCVIAGHCGWGGADYFRYLEKLEIGDKVYITNLWGTMVYTVTETKIIYPNDVESIRIQEGKDMVTLMTCYPYASGGRYRLLVYCERETK